MPCGVVWCGGFIVFLPAHPPRDLKVRTTSVPFFVLSFPRVLVDPHLPRPSDQGVYHRDLKPENLLLDADFTLKVTDYMPRMISCPVRWFTTIGSIDRRSGRRGRRGGRAPFADVTGEETRYCCRRSDRHLISRGGRCSCIFVCLVCLSFPTVFCLFSSFDLASPPPVRSHRQRGSGDKKWLTAA